MSFVGSGERDDLKQATAWLQTVSISAVKPWNEFVAGFELPNKGWQQLEKQAAVNVAYFAGNYFWVAVACQLVSAFYSPLLIVVLLLCTVVCAIVFRPPRELREPLAQILHDDLQRTVACVASAACLLLLCGYLSTVLTNLVVGAALVVAHALTKKITSRSRLSKMWFNVRFFGNRAAEDLPDGGAAQHAHDADIADTAAQGAGGATALDSWGAGSDTMLPQAAPPGPRMQVGSSAAVDVDNIDLEAGSATGPVHRPPSIKRD